MKKLSKILVISVVALLVLSGNIIANGHDGDKKRKKEEAKSSKSVEPNENYKHVIPSSPGNKFKDSFTKPATEKAGRNYKQQNQEKRKVKFKDHFINPDKKDTKSYKHAHGL